MRAIVNACDSIGAIVMGIAAFCIANWEWRQRRRDTWRIDG